MKELLRFLLLEFPAALKGINENSEAQWGSMKVNEMVDHLRKAFDLSIENRNIEVITPADKIPMMQAFLASDKEMRPGAQKPAVYDEVEDLVLSLEDLKLELMRSMVRMLAFFEKNPDYVSVHPNFGEITAEQWMQLHRKHIRHHLKQFGALD